VTEGNFDMRTDQYLAKEPRAASSAIVFPPVDPAHVEKVAEVRRALNEPPA
jgi:hypothetical protein